MYQSNACKLMRLASSESERMYTVELYVKIRRVVMVEGKSEREAARYFGAHRLTVKKMCQYAIPPGYRHVSMPKLTTRSPGYRRLPHQDATCSPSSFLCSLCCFSWCRHYRPLAGLRSYRLFPSERLQFAQNINGLVR